ncbi:MAG: citrate/2-methylcitrate synthase, partial [Blastocatellia bacterium]
MSAAQGYGLEKVVAAATRMSLVDGEAGRLVIGGYEAEDLAPKADFEEVAFLLWNGRLPDPGELEATRFKLAGKRRLGETTIELLRKAAANRVSVVDALLMAIPTLRLGHEEDVQEDTALAVAAFPAIVGSYWRLVKGKEPVTPREDLS